MMTSPEIEHALGVMKAFFEKGERVSYAVNDVIACREDIGENAEYIYFIADGFVRVDTYKQDRQNQAIIMLDTNGLFPVFRIIGKDMMPVQAIATSAVTCYRQTQKEFRKFIQQDPESFAWVVYDQLMNAYGRVYNLSLATAEMRMAQYLLSLGLRYGRPVDNQVWISIPLTHQLLAGAISVSRETAGRILQQFENRDCIVYGRKTIIIWPERLRAILSNP